MLKSSVDGNERKELEALGLQAIKSTDVPVAAMLLYGDSIVGRGYNSVRRDNDAGGHAEINAISDAMRYLGIERFNQMSRDSISLVTTFDPCQMCRGAILEYNIRHVYVYKPKSLLEWLKDDYRTARYEINRNRRGNEEVQDSLFLQHPSYKKSRSEHPASPP